MKAEKNIYKMPFDSLSEDFNINEGLLNVSQDIKINIANKQNSTDENLKTQNKNVVAAINEINDSIASFWVVGEYKWMPTTVTIMPVGWKKVDLNQGYSIIQGTKEGLESGRVQAHFHSLSPDLGVSPWGSVPALAGVIGRFLKIHISDQGGKNVAVANAIDSEWSVLSETQRNRDADNTYTLDNFPAGLNAQLWQYDPNNFFSKTDIIKISLK